ncbi:tetratricopeptide repeat protein [Rhodophyticola sp. CCM32]|uniref:tetratricopeptide repeat protein n=1 Tax=Rhodophyticola sp. CCM32 TaxID=2916397 RepID=UPI00107F4339|nr:tetratricopeptide repeat protein [Rhodophyticola sp. CCM32]QBY00260.1 tetratricopeptide repeat protein [Rhodophyticola sp. CCM32]
MANTDSFLDEVSEEVRRDRLFALLRRWGWIAALAVLLLVGGAAWNEYRNAQATRQAEAFGDAVLAAFDTDDAAARMAALAAAPADTPEEQLILALLQAGEEADGEEAAAAAARLRSLADQSDLPPRYSDLARLRAHMLAPEDPALALALMDHLARPGAPYRALAMEQQAYIRLAQGETGAGIEILRQVQNEAVATPGLQQRAMQLIVALETGAVLVDAPVDDAPVDTVGDDATGEAEEAPESPGTGAETTATE